VSQSSAQSVADKLNAARGDFDIIVSVASEREDDSLEASCVQAWALGVLYRDREATKSPKHCETVLKGFGLTGLLESNGRVPVDVTVGSDVTRVLADGKAIYSAKAAIGAKRVIQLSLLQGDKKNLSFYSSCKYLTMHTISAQVGPITVGRSVQVAPAWASSKIQIDGHLVDTWPVFLAGEGHLVSVEGAPRCKQLLGTSDTIQFDVSCREQTPTPTPTPTPESHWWGIGGQVRTDFTPAGTERVVGVLPGVAFHAQVAKAVTLRAELSFLLTGKHVGGALGMGAELGRLSIFSLVPMAELAHTPISPASGNTSVWAFHPHLRLRAGNDNFAGYLSGGGYFILDNNVSTDDVIARFASGGVGFEGRWFP
jgi:hypothetical protein